MTGSPEEAAATDWLEGAGATAAATGATGRGVARRRGTARKERWFSGVGASAPRLPWARWSYVLGASSDSQPTEAMDGSASGLSVSVPLSLAALAARSMSATASASLAPCSEDSISIPRS